MPRKSEVLRSVGPCAAIMLFVSSALVRAEAELPHQPWAMSLAAQLKAEKHCDVHVSVFVQEMPVSEGTLYSGRIRCLDGREYDFSQAKPHLKFEIKACEPAAC